MSESSLAMRRAHDLLAEGEAEDMSEALREAWDELREDNPTGNPGSTGNLLTLVLLAVGGYIVWKRVKTGLWPWQSSAQTKLAAVREAERIAQGAQQRIRPEENSDVGYRLVHRAENRTQESTGLIFP